MTIKTNILTIGLALSLTLASGLFSQATAREPQLKDIGNGICQDVKSGLMWQVTRSKKFSESQDVEQYLQQLNKGTYSDWRLPTMNELKALRFIFDRKNNGNCTLPRMNSWYWADKAPFNSRPGKLEPNEECGGGYEFVSKEKGAVRAVRP